MTDTNELFPADAMEALSPRLKWMRAYEVNTRDITQQEHPNGTWCAWSGDYEKALRITNEYSPGGCGYMEFGDTEHEAIVRLAEWNEWKLWNEG